MCPQNVVHLFIIFHLKISSTFKFSLWSPIWWFWGKIFSKNYPWPRLQYKKNHFMLWRVYIFKKLSGLNLWVIYADYSMWHIFHCQCWIAKILKLVKWSTLVTVLDCSITTSINVTYSWYKLCINLQIEQLQSCLQQERTVRMMLERAMGRASSTLSPGHRHFAAEVLSRKSLSKDFAKYSLLFNLPYDSKNHGWRYWAENLEPSCTYSSKNVSLFPDGLPNYSYLWKITWQKAWLEGVLCTSILDLHFPCL